MSSTAVDVQQQRGLVNVYVDDVLRIIASCKCQLAGSLAPVEPKANIGSVTISMIDVGKVLGRLLEQQFKRASVRLLSPS